MQIEHIELHSGDLDRPYEKLTPIRARVTAATLFSKTPTLEDVNFNLREEAAKAGANAVIQVEYKRGVSAMSWKALTATGIAVKAESDTMSCPECAETVKRGARKCKHCGASLVPAS